MSDARPMILCVDDDPAILCALRRALSREPYDVVTTLDPREALDRVRREDVEIVIVDERMPAMQGVDLLGAIAERSPRTIRVMLTGYPDTRVVLQRLHGGIARLLTKPWDSDELKQTIAELLKERAA